MRRFVAVLFVVLVAALIATPAAGARRPDSRAPKVGICLPSPDAAATWPRARLVRCSGANKPFRISQR
jgi:hypothetical protein